MSFPQLKDLMSNVMSTIALKELTIFGVNALLILLAFKICVHVVRKNIVMKGCILLLTSVTMDGITKLFFAKEGVVISDLFLWCSVTRQERKRNVEKYCLNCRE